MRTRFPSWIFRSDRGAFAVFLALLAFLVQLSGCQARDATKCGWPGGRNIVLILCDDLGPHDLGCTGSERIATPNLDLLRDQGMLFTQAYSGAPVCAPSRASLLTGHSMGHCQIRDNSEALNLPDGTFGGQRGLAAGTRTLASVLRDAGYATGAFGKWGLGGPADASGHPLDQGFDRFFGYLCQRNAHNHYPSYLESDRGSVTLEGNSRALTGAVYAPDRILAEAEAWLGTVASRPFFLYFATALPHLALQAPADAIDRYSFEENVYDGKGGYLAHDRPRAAYAAMVSQVDAAVGELVAALDARGLREETLILFTSDNGATFALGGYDPGFFRSNGDLRGHKGQLYEGGIRVPLIASWPGRIAVHSMCSEPVIGYDLFPTILSVAAVAAVAAAPASDGVNLAPVMLGEVRCETLATRSPLVWEHPSGAGWQAVRDGRWKLVRRQAKDASRAHFELFDLASDPAESRDCAGAEPAVVARLAAVMAERDESPVAAWNYAPLAVPASAAQAPITVPAKP